MKKITAITIAIIFASTTSFAQDPRNSDIKVNAKVDAGCFLDAENINFGVLQMPLQDQTASANMRLHCSKGSPLSISIRYGNLSTSGNLLTGITFADWVNTNGKEHDWQKVYKDGKAISSQSFDLYCHQAKPNEIGINSVEMAKFINLNKTEAGTTWIQDTAGVCTSGSKINKTQAIVFMSGIVDVGSLKGMGGYEQINFYLEKPQTTNKWSSDYLITSTGVEQVVPMKASIKRADNVTHRMTPDTYQSVLTVVLTY